MPCCFGAGRCSCYSSVSSSSNSRISEGTLGTFSVRFCGLFVLPCLAVLVPGGALATLLLAAATAAAAGELMGDWKSGKGWEKDIFSRNSEGTLGTFSVRFCGLFVLPCLAVLVPGGALATPLLTAATAAAAAGELMGDWKSGKGWEKDIFSKNSEGTLGTFSVRFCGLFVLPCLAVLVPGGALATLLLAAAAAAAAAAAGELMGDWKSGKGYEKKHFF